MSALAASLDRLVPEVLRMTGMPGLSVAVGCAGRLECAVAYGWHDVPAARPLTPASVFPAGSMTKLYTAVAVLQLVEAGVVGLHDPVEAHLDGIACLNPLGARAVTVHDLLTFRSGLAVDTTATSLGTPPPLRDHVEAALRAPHGREYAGGVPRWGARVGERYQYANLGISVLGLLVALRNPEGLPLRDYLARRIISPLGMRSTWLSDWTEPAPPERATGYACFAPFAVPTPEIRSADHPANGLQTTPSDHLRLLLALAGGGALDGVRILRPETVRLMLTPQVPMGAAEAPGTGGDWWTGLVAILHRAGERDGHFGQPGAHSWGWWSVSRAYPELDCAVVACCNGWDMMRWHNPANREPATIVADHVASWFGAGAQPDPGGDWRARRSRLAGAILAERTNGSLGVAEPLGAERVDALLAGATGDLDHAAFRAGVLETASGPLDAQSAAGALHCAARDALLQDLGMVYGFPAPLWFW